MLRDTFDPQKKNSIVIYARMSTEMQNSRSPDQQINTIKDLISRLNLPWEVVAVYRDQGKSGRYARKRHGYQKMLNDLKSGKVKAALIAVDTFERLSRAEDNADVRRDLARHGIYVVTADSNFENPNSVSGKALTFVESFRATEESRIKAHNVVRGKKDAIIQGHWPGGPPPFGFRLKNNMIIRKGVEEIDYRIIEPDHEKVEVVRRIFELAAHQNLGANRISKQLNQDPEVPEKFKPFSISSIDCYLQNELYYGEMIWGKYCYGIVDDVRVRQPVPEEEWVRNEKFCEPIVDKALWDLAAKNRTARRRKKNDFEVHSSPRHSNAMPQANGIALKYPLSGLVVCSSCGRAMVATSGALYVTKSGDSRRYVSYRCPARFSNVCDNHFSIPEEWLRQTVLNLIRQQLFSISQ